MAASTHSSALLRRFKKKKPIAASSLPVKGRLWKYIEIFNIISGGSDEIVKFIECRSIITNQFQKKKRVFFLGLKHISSYIIHPFRGAHILVFHCVPLSAPVVTQ